MPRQTVTSRKNPMPRKKTTTQRPEVLEVTPDIASLPDLDASIHEDDDDNGLGQEPDTISRASSSGEPTASTSTFAPPRELLPKKTVPSRVSHRNITNYEFTESQLTTLRDFIKEHPELYVKTNRSYCNHYVKNDLWHKCAALFEGCTYLQCRKYFEQKRTAFGKIEKTEIRSGSARRDRTAREEKIMNEWEFLKGNISHSSTTTSQVFTSPNSPGHHLSENESSSGSESGLSGLSATSIERRRKILKKGTGDVSASSQDIEEVPASQSDVEITSSIRRLIGQAATITSENREPWLGSNVYHFSKMIANQVYELPPEDRDQAMMGAMSYVLGLKKKTKCADAQSQTVERAPVVDANPAPNVAAPPGQAPIIHAPTLQYGNPAPTQIVQSSGYPATPSWFIQHLQPTSVTTPTSVYPLGPQQQPMPYAHPPITTYQPYVPPPVPTTQPSTSGYVHPPTSGYVPPTTTAAYVPPATSGYVPPATSTSTSLQSSPSIIFKDIDSLTELKVFRTTASTLNTPQGTDVEDADP